MTSYYLLPDARGHLEKRGPILLADDFAVTLGAWDACQKRVFGGPWRR
jgi:hypothetical protein